MRFVLVDRRCRLQRGIDNAPRFLDIVFASEQRAVACYGIAEDAFVRRHLARRRMMAEYHLNRLYAWFITARHHCHAKRDSYLGTDAEAEMIRRHLGFANH